MKNKKNADLLEEEKYLDEAKNKLCKGLRRARKRAGITRVKLALDLGVSDTTIKKWEYGDSQISIIDLNRLAHYYSKNYFDCDIMYLMGDDYSTREIKQICQYTNLSEAAIDVLHNGFEIPMSYYDEWEDTATGEKIYDEGERMEPFSYDYEMLSILLENYEPFEGVVRDAYHCLNDMKDLYSSDINKRYYASNIVASDLFSLSKDISTCMEKIAANYYKQK